MLRLLFAGLLVVVMCVYSGVTDILEARHSGGSPRNGIETLCVALIFALLISFVGRREARKLADSLRS